MHVEKLGLKLKLRIVRKRNYGLGMRFCGGSLKLIVFKNIITKTLTTRYYSVSQVNPKILPIDLLRGVKHKTQCHKLETLLF